MNASYFWLILAILTAAVFLLTTTAIATECYNVADHKAFKDRKKGNEVFTNFAMGLAILIIVICFIGFYVAFSSD